MATVKAHIKSARLNLSALTAGVSRVMNEVLDQHVDKDFQLTFATFNHKPEMHKEYASTAGKNKVVATEWTADENYVRLNYGTPDHVVGAAGQYMSFQPTYYIKSRPGVINSTSGGHFGLRQRARGPWPVRGIEPRNFDETIKFHVQPILQRALEKEFGKS